MGAMSSREALQALQEGLWAPKGQLKVFPESKQTLPDPPLTAKTCLRTIHLPHPVYGGSKDCMAIGKHVNAVLLAR